MNDYYLIKGAFRSALYDFKQKQILSIDNSIASILEGLCNGKNLRQIFTQKKFTKSKEKILEETLQKLPNELMKEGNLSLNINERLSSEILPTAVWIDITEECNLRCAHCYSSSAKPLSHELNENEWKEALVQLNDNGYKHFHIVGGEPFSKDFIKSFLLNLASLKPQAIEVVTNATLLTNEIATFIKENNISLLISFYSFSEKTHEEVTKVKGSFQKTVDGIKKVIDADINYLINIPLSSINQYDLDKTIEFLVSLGCNEKKISPNIVYPMGRGCQDEIIPDDTIKFNQKKPIYSFSTNKEGLIDYGTCWAGKLLVKANGDVTCCPSARDERFVSGNIRNKPLNEILKNSTTNKNWSLTLDEINICDECEFRYACFDCRAVAFAHTNEINSKNPYCLYNPKEGRWQMPIELDKYHDKSEFIRSGKYSYKWLDDELCVYKENSEEIMMFNKVAAEIYLACEGGNSVRDIVDLLLKTFDVEEERLKSDVIAILADMVDKRVIISKE